MKLIHTGDWHAGKKLRGVDRLPDLSQALNELVQLAESEQVDAVLIAGDVYDSTAPSPAAQRLVIATLLRLVDAGAEVIVISGNHDNARELEAYRPLLEVANIHVSASFRRPDDGGVVSFTTRAGEPVNVAVLPFLSQRYAVKAADLLTGDTGEHSANYEARVRGLIDALTSSFTPDAVNIVLSHLTVTGAAFGGGERESQSIFDYHVNAAAFGVTPTYVALGHLHRYQTIPAAAPVVYAGSPIQVDFGETANTTGVVLVEAHPGQPAIYEQRPLTGGRQLRTLTGTVDELTRQAEHVGDDLLRLVVNEPTFVGLREQLHDALPNTLQIRIAEEYAAQPATDTASFETVQQTSPHDLFNDYLTQRQLSDPKLLALFDELLEERHESSH